MRLLLVEDEEKLALTLQRGLEREGYAVDVMLDGAEALARLRVNHSDYDLVVLDVMLPGEDGLSICRRLRTEGVAVPILMLTARDATADKVAGLDSGADDYLVKPFAFEELLARIRTLLRRPPQVLPPRLQVGDLALEPHTRAVTRGAREIALTTKEFTLLEYFMRNAGEVLTREQIMSHAWDFDYEGFSNVVDVHVKNLRAKIDVKGAPKLFHTVRGVGYVLRE
jgi:DNA-binding response OmpR family regulator